MTRKTVLWMVAAALCVALAPAAHAGGERANGKTPKSDHPEESEPGNSAGHYGYGYGHHKCDDDHPGQGNGPCDNGAGQERITVDITAFVPGDDPGDEDFDVEMQTQIRDSRIDEATWYYAFSGNFQTEGFRIGDVDCLTALDGDTVAFSGTQYENEDGPMDHPYLVWVHDGGPNGAGDWIRVMLGSNATLNTCATHPWTVSGMVPADQRWEINGGDIAVHVTGHHG